MAGFDYRTKSNNEVSFYVVDDLRYQQNAFRRERGSFDIFRYDTLSEAMGKFRDVPADMTPAIGMHISERSELDLIHRRNGENVLVTDFFNFAPWRTNENVLAAVKELCEILNVEWQMNSSLIKGGTILIPYERGFDRVPDKVFDNKNLASKQPPIYSDNTNPIPVINEAYVEGVGWCPIANILKYTDPHLLKISQFNINYVDDKGHTGQADITPFDLQILKERHAILFCNEHVRNDAIQKLAEELDEFAIDFCLYEYRDQVDDREQHIEQLKKDFSEGKVSEVVTFLRDVAEDNEEHSARALLLASRLHGLSVLERKPELDSKIKDAAHKSERVSEKEENIQYLDKENER